VPLFDFDCGNIFKLSLCIDSNLKAKVENLKHFNKFDMPQTETAVCHRGKITCRLQKAHTSQKLRVFPLNYITTL